MKERHQVFHCSFCGVTRKTARLLKNHVKTQHQQNPDPSKPKKIVKPRVWKSSFPVDKDTYHKMKTDRNTTCPNCKRTFTSFGNLAEHFATVKCKKDHKAVEASPDMIIVIRNGEKVTKMVKGEKHR